jgi:hypothetical protein
MSGRVVRGAAAMAAAAALTFVAGSPASAGGGTMLRPDREFYEPGDLVVLEGEAYKPHRDWRGPYRLWLARWPEANQPVNADGATGPVPKRYVGDLVIERRNELYVRASVSFTMPDLPRGGYDVQMCNPGCTDNLDWTRGVVFIGAGLVGRGPQPVVTADVEHEDPAPTAPVASTTPAPVPTSLVTAAQPAPAPPTGPAPTGPMLLAAVVLGGLIFVAIRSVRARREDDDEPPRPPGPAPAPEPTEVFLVTR